MRPNLQQKKKTSIILDGSVPHPRGLNTLANELTVATHIMQSSSNKLSTSVSDSLKCKQTITNTYTLNSRAGIGATEGKEVCYRSDIKLGRFQSQLEASCVSSHTEELYNETVCLWTTVYIYIYIYIYIPNYIWPGLGEGKTELKI